MRTTLNIDDDVFQTVRAYAELVRRGLAAARPTRTVNGLQVFDLSRDSPRVTSKRIRELEGTRE
jgi:hypothetical protein